ncbi:polysaccharide deacetylase family protein [Streptomyces sp. SID13031]|uniref:polysaccharide deacetylase family protein n=1 Tax=Streptomyces sp. SID13031 TaxID=2706046 RepID=UPI0013C549B3|nr:polysaccharide deacetylase family protein [Streptomyces sp. SID13031]NEA31079.1 polysaccharide deacetylase family protein [Streptomyces sp. SID13031]
MRHRFAVQLGALALLTGSLFAIGQPAAAATNTVVTMTFDDGLASHVTTVPMLQSRGMRGTFYINSAMVGTSSYYMTWPQIHTIADAGSEIGGHTLHHINLTNVSQATATTEVCNDRSNLIAQGFPAPASFAYPEADYNNTAKQVVQNCGYSSARTVGDIRGPDCDDCDYAETIPPDAAYALRGPDSAESSTTLATMQKYVTQAETHGGGWVVLSFHGICSDSCTGDSSFSPTTFNAFLDWLKAREASGTVVKTVGEVMGGGGPAPASPPVTTIKCNGAACTTAWNLSSPVNVDLTATDADGSAIASTRYTTDGSNPVTSATAVTYTGPFGLTATKTVKYYSTDVDGHVEATKSQQIRVDAVAPAVALTSPANNSTYRRTASVPLAATATDTGGSGVAKVVFRDGTTTLKTDTSSPYNYSWSATKSVGAHTVTAVATDVAGNVTSTAVTVNIIR